ncbi:hypothetical protein C8R47DRAFT_740646 [Mycena vitilis]|nr:hypothetical protein C8R47DRAFT_740646 [Mycena vitilis]
MVQARDSMDSEEDVPALVPWADEDITDQPPPLESAWPTLSLDTPETRARVRRERWNEEVQVSREAVFLAAPHATLGPTVDLQRGERWRVDLQGGGWWPFFTGAPILSSDTTCIWVLPRFHTVVHRPPCKLFIPPKGCDRQRPGAQMQRTGRQRRAELGISTGAAKHNKKKKGKNIREVLGWKTS